MRACFVLSMFFCGKVLGAKEERSLLSISVSYIPPFPFVLNIN